ncbi:MAG TPA: MFS transporter [Puia sp.]|nr:MFS transporter [Puia sp.]
MKVSKRYAWTVVALLWGVALLNYMDRQMLSTMRPSMEKDIPELQSAENFGYLMAIFLWIYGCMSPVAGWIADRFNRKWLIVASLVVWSGVTFAMGFAHSFHQLFALRAVMGISEALYLPAGLSLIVDYHSSGSRSLAVGVHMTGIYLGQALGGFGATVAAFYSWHATFQWFGLVGVGYAVLLGVCLRERKGAAGGAGERLEVGAGELAAGGHGAGSILRGLLRIPAFYLILFYFAAASLPGWAVKNWLPTLAAQNLRLDMSKAGPIVTITLSVASLLGVLAGGAVSDRWVARTSRGRIYTSCIGLALTIPSLLLIGLGHSTAGTIAALSGFGLGLGITDANYMPILCQIVPSSSRATGYGLMNTTGVFAGAWITGVLGQATDRGHLGTGFAALAGVVLLAVFAQFLFLKPNAREL